MGHNVIPFDACLTWTRRRRPFHPSYFSLGVILSSLRSHLDIENTFLPESYTILHLWVLECVHKLTCFITFNLIIIVHCVLSDTYKYVRNNHRIMHILRDCQLSGFGNGQFYAYFTDSWVNIRLSQCQWSNLYECGYIHNVNTKRYANVTTANQSICYIWTSRSETGM